MRTRALITKFFLSNTNWVKYYASMRQIISFRFLPEISIFNILKKYRSLELFLEWNIILADNKHLLLYYSDANRTNCWFYGTFLQFEWWWVAIFLPRVPYIVSNFCSPLIDLPRIQLTFIERKPDPDLTWLHGIQYRLCLSLCIDISSLRQGKIWNALQPQCAHYF